MDCPKLTIKHVGINCPDEAAAHALTASLCDCFSLQPCNETDSHIFAGGLFEVMKNEAIGSRGHIALQTEDIAGAIAYFAEKGIAIREDTVRRADDGSITFAYLDLELGGFAFHLTR